MLQAIVPNKVPVRNSGKPSRASKNFQLGGENRHNGLYPAHSMTLWLS